MDECKFNFENFKRDKLRITPHYMRWVYILGVIWAILMAANYFLDVPKVINAIGAAVGIAGVAYIGIGFGFAPVFRETLRRDRAIALRDAPSKTDVPRKDEGPMRAQRIVNGEEADEESP